MSVYGTNLKKLRNEKGATQEEIAKYSGKTKATISKYERGDILPTIDVAKKIADFFCVSIDSMTMVVQTNESSITEKSAKELIGLSKGYIRAVKVAYQNNIAPDKLIELLEFSLKF